MDIRVVVIRWLGGTAILGIVAYTALVWSGHSSDVLSTLVGTAIGALSSFLVREKEHTP